MVQRVERFAYTHLRPTAMQAHSGGRTVCAPMTDPVWSVKEL